MAKMVIEKKAMALNSGNKFRRLWEDNQGSQEGSMAQTPQEKTTPIWLAGLGGVGSFTKVPFIIIFSLKALRVFMNQMWPKETLCPSERCPQ